MNSVNKHFELTANRESLVKQSEEFADVAKQMKSIRTPQNLSREMVEKLIEKTTVKDHHQLEIAFIFENAFPLIDEVLQLVDNVISELPLKPRLYLLQMITTATIINTTAVV